MHLWLRPKAAPLFTFRHLILAVVLLLETQCPAAAELFAQPSVFDLSIEIPRSGVTSLRRDPRGDVRCTLREGRAAWTNVFVHLKGATGSFQPIDEKPGFTLIFDRVAREQRFHGRRKIHLNNSIEDPSFMSELLGSELFRAAGIPATRVSYAIVHLNGKRLGLYVLKEAFDEEFLASSFENGSGRLYEPGEGRDVGENLDEKTGRDAGDGRELMSLAEAATEPDLERRWKRLGERLEMDQFITFMALEVIIAHRDGYCLMRNNYRIYERPRDGRAVFLPHGMDQLFGSAPSSLDLRMNGLVGRAVMETSEGIRQYHERAAVLLTNVFLIEVLSKRVDATVELLEPYLTRAENKAVRAAAEELKQRISTRHQRMSNQVLAHRR